MRHIEITKGLDVPMTGNPEQTLPAAPTKVELHALLGADYHGLKPRMAVEEGSEVKKGSPLFKDKKDTQVVYTSPVSGRVVAINRGLKRALVSVVIASDGRDEQLNLNIAVKPPAQLKLNEVVSGLTKSGLWTALRTRPFSKVPLVKEQPQTIFVNAMAPDQYAAEPNLFFAQHLTEFVAGLQVLAVLAQQRVFVCCAQKSSLITAQLPNPKVEVVTFGGKYPASLSGTHMHFLYPAGRTALNFSLNYQDVAAIGRFFSDGYLMTERLLSFAGPAVAKPHLLVSSLGADLTELASQEELIGKQLLISGGALSGRAAHSPAAAFLGRYHLQITALERGDWREFMGWLSPGVNKFSLQNIYLSAFNRQKKLPLSGSTNGSTRAMVPMSTFERVVPLQLLPTQLLRALVVGDIETAERLGCLELDEEDLALCSFVCSAKYIYGEALRANLQRIEKENWGL